MAGPRLPVNNDATYPDVSGDPSIKAHQQHHDKVHAIVNRFDTAVGTTAPTDGHVLTAVGGVYLPRPLPTAHPATEMFFSELAGASDDEKLDAFMAGQRSHTDFKGRTLVLDEQRDYQFYAQHELYSGFSLRGPFRPQDQARSSRPIGNRVLLRMTGGLFTLPAGNTFGVSISNLSIDGSYGNRLIDGRPDGVLWTSTFADISTQNCDVFGSAAQRLLVTACSIRGFWNVNNVRDRGLAFGGSDFFVAPDMFLLDSPATLLGASKYLMSLEWQSNCHLQHFYITAEGHAALLVSGGSSAESVWITHSVIEGRNANQFSPGALIRHTGGQLALRDTRLAFAMGNPSATGRDDAGVIHSIGGSLFVDGVTYRRAAGVGEDVPLIYAAGSAKVRVRNVIPQGFTGKPVVRQTTDGLIDADNSVTVVTG